MAEQDLVICEPAVVVTSGTLEVDGRGWLMALIAMVMIGLWSLRPSPAPIQPQQIPHQQSVVWMADALPGVGVKTRDLQWQRIQAGEIDSLPQRSRGIAREVFTWTVSSSTTGSGSQSHR